MADEFTEKEIEYLLLLLLATSKLKQLSHLHIQKMMFLLRDASAFLQPLFHFIKYYRGPFSKDIKEALTSPMYLDNCWTFIKANDKLTGGYIKLTDQGKKRGEELVNNIRKKRDQKLNQILAAMTLLHDIYDNLSAEELLYIIYKSPKFKEFTEKSTVYDDVITEEVRKKLERKFVEN